MSAASNGGFAALVRRITAFVLRLRLVRAYLRYSGHQGSTLADSITYRTLFSVFAAVLLTFSLAALWLGDNPDAIRALTETLDTMIPGLSGIVDPSRIAAPTGLTIVGAVSVVGLLSAAIGAIASLRIALRVLADELHDDGFFFWVLLRNLLVSLLFGGLLALAAALTVFGTVGISTIAAWIGTEEAGALVSVFTRVFTVLVVLLIDTVAIAAVFRMLSGMRASRRALWTGALLGGVGLTVLQELSGLFVRGATSNPLLATFAALIALLLWFNLSAQVILIASSYIVTAEIESRERAAGRPPVRTLAQWRLLRAEELAREVDRELRAAREAEAAERRGTGAEAEPGADREPGAR